MDKEILLSNIDKVHTTEMGIDRIKKNLGLDTNDVVEWCKNKVLDEGCNVYRQGKNWYCEIDNANQGLKAREGGRKTAQKSRECKYVANKSHNTLLRCLRQ